MAHQPQQPYPQQPQQPGAQPIAGLPRPRILRVGVVLGGKIVEERLLRRRETVTIGQSAKNTFAIPVPDLPRSWPLFVLAGNRYVLNVADGMDGRLSDGARVHTVAQLKASGQMPRRGAGYQLALPEAARGKITLGDLTLLFQFVTAPPAAARPQLPHSVRGRLSDRIDPYMAVVMALSLLFHGGVGLYIYRMDVPAPPAPDEIPDRFAKALLERPKQPEKVEEKGTLATDAKGQEEKGDAKADSKASSKRDDKKDGGDGGKKAAPDHAAVSQAVQDTALVRVLGVYGSSGDGRFMELGGKETAGDLDKGLANVAASGTGLATASGGSALGGGTRGPATGQIGTGKYTGTTGPSGPAAVGPAHEEREVKVDVKTGGLDTIDDGGLDPTKVMQTIKTKYFGGVRKCYEQELKLDNTLSGKVVVSFTVGAAGNVIKVNVSGFNAKVDACIESKARGWRFDKPEGSAEFEIPFILRPGQ